MPTQLIVKIKIPLPDMPNVPKAERNVLNSIVLKNVKAMFPTENLPKGSTVDYEIVEIAPYGDKAQ